MSTLILPYPSTHPDLCHGKYVAGLFAKGEQGAWYDPSDLSTLYQDAAGTIPVTAVGQPVGLMLDKSKGLVFGPELVTNGDFGQGTSGWIVGWGATAVVSENQLEVNVAPDTYGRAARQVNLVIGKTYKITGQVRRGTATNGAYIAGAGGGIPTSPLISSTSLTTWTAYFTATSAVGEIRLLPSSAVGSGGTAYFANISVRELPGHHATQSTTTSRPTLQQDTSGKYYLSFDGVDDYLSTGSIDFTGTDKMTVFAGVRKLSDAAGFLAELSAERAVNNGAWSLIAPGGLGVRQGYYFSSKGTLDSSNGVDSGYASPITNILTGLGDISGDLATLRVNGTQAASRTADQGTGNYGNYPLYIGRRGGTSLPFNGRLYGLIVRGAATDDAHLTHAEKFLAYKSGVTL